MKIGILYSDGKFTKQRKNKLMGKEMLYVQKALRELGVHVDILSVTNSEVADVIIENSEQLNAYEKLILFSCTVNQWGGQLNEAQCLAYKFLHNYKGKIYCWFEDLREPLKQLTNVLRGRKFWEDAPMCSLEELVLPSDIKILSMFNNQDIVRKAHKDIEISDIYTIPIYKTHVDGRKCNEPLFGRTVDLIYGGFGRSKKRNNFYIDYFINRNKITTELYGTIKNKDLSGVNTKKCSLTEEVNYEEVLSKNATALCTIIPAEEGYNNNCITPRFIEALLSDTICFIENDFDIEHRIYGDNFFYCSSGDELENKILQLKENYSFYIEKLKIQQEVREKLLSADLGKILFDAISS